MPVTGNTTGLQPIQTTGSVRNAGSLFESAVAGKPTIHDVGERIRIAKGIDPERIAEFTGIHEAVAFPGDNDPDADDFREEAYGQLRSEIRMTYAEVASARNQIVEVKRGVELLRQMVAITTTQYATGKLDQAQVVKGQIEGEKLLELLLLLEKKEKIFSIRLNVLIGVAPEEPVPPLEALREYSPTFTTSELIESYKSRRFLALFQTMVKPDFTVSSGEGSHGIDSLEVESTVFISIVRISLENLYQRARLYRTSLISKAESAHATRLELYKNGKLDFLTVVEGLVVLAELQREYQSLLGEAHVLKAKVEYVTGTSIEL
jgi:Outer membrane efflux protein